MKHWLTMMYSILITRKLEGRIFDLFSSLMDYCKGKNILQMDDILLSCLSCLSGLNVLFK